MKKPMNLNFIGARKVCWIISACVIAIGLLFNIVFGVEMDVEFKGGTMMKYSYTGTVDAQAAASFFSEQIGTPATAELSTGYDQDGNVVPLLNVYTTAVVDSEQQEAITEAAAKQFADSGIDEYEISSVTPTVGNSFFVKCMVAVALASVFLVIYVAFRFKKIGGWSAGLMAVMALLHDLLMVYFTFVIFRIPLDGNFVAVMLTILGYSLNDTIVIYDRIRENRSRMGADANIGDVVNLSLNQSFTRTLNTSVSTAIVVATLVVVALVMNIEAIISFAVPLFFGIISGFYSSLFLCAPTWAVWAERRSKKAKAKK